MNSDEPQDEQYMANEEFRNRQIIENMQARTGFGGFVKNTWTMSLNIYSFRFFISCCSCLG